SPGCPFSSVIYALEVTDMKSIHAKLGSTVTFVTARPFDSKSAGSTCLRSVRAPPVRTQTRISNDCTAESDKKSRGLGDEKAFTDFDGRFRDLHFCGPESRASGRRCRNSAFQTRGRVCDHTGRQFYPLFQAGFLRYRELFHSRCGSGFLQRS